MELVPVKKTRIRLHTTNFPFLIRFTILGGSDEKDGDRSSGCDIWLIIGKLPVSLVPAY